MQKMRAATGSRLHLLNPILSGVHPTVSAAKPKEGRGGGGGGKVDRGVRIDGSNEHTCRSRFENMPSSTMIFALMMDTSTKPREGVQKMRAATGSRLHPLNLVLSILHPTMSAACVCVCVFVWWGGGRGFAKMRALSIPAGRGLQTCRPPR